MSCENLLGPRFRIVEPSGKKEQIAGLHLNSEILWQEVGGSNVLLQSVRDVSRAKRRLRKFGAGVASTGGRQNGAAILDDRLSKPAGREMLISARQKTALGRFCILPAGRNRTHAEEDGQPDTRG